VEINYLETLHFIGKCLTLSKTEDNRSEVLNILKKRNVSWDLIIKVSTAHLVFPALYCNFKDAGFLNLIPKDLVDYMTHLYELNHNRNLKIMEQVREINKLMLTNKISPIFLKGTSFLIEELYNSIGERMIGDIDFLVSEHQFSKTIKIFKEYGYISNTNEEDNISPSKHYPKMVKKGSIAAIEIHSKIVLNKYSKLYNYKTFIKDTRKINNINIPSLKNQIIHNCINKQFSDKGKYYRNPSFRNSYDLFRLSFKVNPLVIIKNEAKLFNTFNSYLLQSYLLFRHKNLNYFKNYKSKIETNLFLILINYKNINKIYKYIFIQLKKIKTRSILILRMTYKPTYRSYFYRKYLKL
jgi:hypothetical protein